MQHIAAAWRWCWVFLLLLPWQTTDAQQGVDCEIVLEIWQIQGAEEQANCVDERVRLEDNIVTRVGPVGFFIQTPPERSDGDPTTSDGLYVLTNFPPVAWGVEQGSRIHLEGRVREFYALTQLEVSGQRRVEVISSGDGPAAVEPLDLTAADLTPAADGTHPLERYEGMLVTVRDATVVAPTNQFDEFGISLINERSFREPGIEPDMTPEFAGMGLPEWDLNPHLVEVDPPEMGLDVIHAPVGSIVTVTGGLSYAYRDYQIWATEVVIEERPFELRPVRMPELDEFTIATQNVENLFDLTDDPQREDATFEDYVPDDEQAYAARLTKTSAQIREMLQAPDVVALQEVENTRVLADLIQQIQTDDPTLTYHGCLLEGNDGRGIDNAYLIQTERVTVYDCYRLPGSLDEPGASERTLYGRPPLVLEVDLLLEDGRAERLLLINVHIKSLSGSETSRVQTRRMLQASGIAQFVQEMQHSRPNTHIVVLGDLNGFQFSDGLVDVVGIIAGNHDPAEALVSPEEDLVEPDLINQVMRVPASDRYSYIYNSTLQVLDHILTTQSLDPYIRDVQFSRGNADALRIWHMDPEQGARRSSDHDGLVMYLSFEQEQPAP